MFNTGIIFKLVTVLLCCALSEALTYIDDAFPGLKEIRSQPESNWTVEEFVRGHGYPIETHIVKTEDKYFLTLHRIPYGKSGPSTNRPVVFIQHGFIANSASWLVTGPEDSIAFLCADAGYDVWLGNARGSTLSRKHETIDPDKNPEIFFDFTFHEMGKRDMSSVIDYILLVTGQIKISYIGHSMGCTMFFVFLSERPEYNTKIKVMFALAPVVYLQGPITETGFRPFEQIHLVAAEFGVYEIYSYKQFREYYDYLLCGLSDYWASFCDFTIQLLAGIYNPHTNTTAYPILFKTVPAGATVKTIAHYAQLSRFSYPILFKTVPAGATVKTIAHYAQLSRFLNEFKQFDYGLFQNYFKYGSFFPPLYDLSKITCPLHLYYGSDDLFTPDLDMYRLASKFPRYPLTFKRISGYKHTDFLLANDLKGLYNTIIQQDKAT